MKPQRVLVSCEGPTEENFVRSCLVGPCSAVNVYPQTSILLTKLVVGGPDHRGGAMSWTQIRDELVALCGDSNASAITTLYDLYGLPSDVPGWRPATDGMSPRDRALAIESAIAAEIGEPRLRPYLQVHEFEALVLTDPAGIAARSGQQQLERQIASAVDRCGGPEMVNDSPLTAPSKRLAQWWPGYSKTNDGPALVRDAGLEHVRQRCPHFDSWLTWLMSLGT